MSDTGSPALTGLRHATAVCGPQTIRRTALPLFALPLFTLAACAGPDAAPGDLERDAQPPAAVHSPDASAGADGSAQTVFTERAAVFMLADSARLEEIRQKYDAEDYATVGDDMMWYRAEAWSWLEDRGIAVVTLDGRPTLSFRVAGAIRTFDFGDFPTADVVVLYEPDREPRAVAPIDVTTAAQEYFGIP